MRDKMIEAFEGLCLKHGYSIAKVQTVPPKYHEGDTQTAWLFYEAAHTEQQKLLDEALLSAEVTERMCEHLMANLLEAAKETTTKLKQRSE